MKSSFFNQALQITKFGIFFIFFESYIIDSTILVGPSMLPTFGEKGEVVLIDKYSKKLFNKEYDRGEIIVAKHPTNPKTFICKRIIGKGDDLLLVKKDYHRELIKIPKGTYWLEGDNAPNSSDSRRWGPIPSDLIIGKIIFRIYPFSQSYKLTKIPLTSSKRIDEKTGSIIS